MRNVMKSSAGTKNGSDEGAKDHEYLQVKKRGKHTVNDDLEISRRSLTEPLLK
jgi:hypothetical protein